MIVRINNYKKVQKSNTYANDYRLVFDVQVLEIIELNKRYIKQQKLKTVFIGKSEGGMPKTVIYWGERITLENSDFVNMKGRFIDDLFLAFDIQVARRANP